MTVFDSPIIEMPWLPYSASNILAVTKMAGETWSYGQRVVYDPDNGWWRATFIAVASPVLSSGAYGAAVTSATVIILPTMAVTVAPGTRKTIAANGAAFSPTDAGLNGNMDSQGGILCPVASAPKIIGESWTAGGGLYLITDPSSPSFLLYSQISTGGDRESAGLVATAAAAASDDTGLTTAPAQSLAFDGAGVHSPYAGTGTLFGIELDSVPIPKPSAEVWTPSIAVYVSPDGLTYTQTATAGWKVAGYAAYGAPAGATVARLIKRRRIVDWTDLLLTQARPGIELLYPLAVSRRVFAHRTTADQWYVNVRKYVLVRGANYDSPYARDRQSVTATGSARCCWAAAVPDLGSDFSWLDTSNKVVVWWGTGTDGTESAAFGCLLNGDLFYAASDTAIVPTTVRAADLIACEDDEGYHTVMTSWPGGDARTPGAAPLSFRSRLFFDLDTSTSATFPGSLPRRVGVGATIYTIVGGVGVSTYRIKLQQASGIATAPIYTDLTAWVAPNVTAGVYDYTWAAGTVDPGTTIESLFMLIETTTPGAPPIVTTALLPMDTNFGAAPLITCQNIGCQPFPADVTGAGDQTGSIGVTGGSLVPPVNPLSDALPAGSGYTLTLTLNAGPKRYTLSATCNRSVTPATTGDWKDKLTQRTAQITTVGSDGRLWWWGGNGAFRGPAWAEEPTSVTLGVISSVADAWGDAGNGSVFGPIDLYNPTPDPITINVAVELVAYGHSWQWGQRAVHDRQVYTLSLPSTL